MKLDPSERVNTNELPSKSAAPTDDRDKSETPNPDLEAVASDNEQDQEQKEEGDDDKGGADKHGKKRKAPKKEKLRPQCEYNLYL